MKLGKKQALEAQKRVKVYEASMAIEGLSIHPEDREVLDRMTREGAGYEDGVRLAIKHLRERGVIPADRSKPDVAAE